jgi:hypothetical protein
VILGFAVESGDDAITDWGFAAAAALGVFVNEDGNRRRRYRYIHSVDGGRRCAEAGTGAEVGG